MILTSIMSTIEAAKASGVSRITLERWLAAGKIARPKILKVGLRKFRLWTAQDVERVKKFKAKHYRKGRGRKSGHGKVGK